MCVHLFVCARMCGKCNWPHLLIYLSNNWIPLLSHHKGVVGSSQLKERHWSILGAATSLRACDVCQTREEWDREGGSEWVSKRERGAKGCMCVWYTHLATVQTNLVCWGSDESWDLWRKESQGRRKKKNTESMTMAHRQTEAKQYL